MRTAVVRDRQESEQVMMIMIILIIMDSEQVCRMLLQEIRRHEVSRCREHSQVITHYFSVRLFLIYFNLNQH